MGGKGGNVKQEGEEEWGVRLRKVNEDGVNRRGRGATRTGVMTEEWEEERVNGRRYGRRKVET